MNTLMNKKVFVHLGMAKCASSSIQEALSKCDSIDYVGVIPDETNRQVWADPKFAELFDRNLRFSCDNLEFWKNYIHRYIEQSDQKTIVFSSENLTLRFLPWDLPTHLKLPFLQKIFPKETQFIYVYRPAQEMLLSLYKDWVMLGYKEPFQSFVHELYIFKDISFFNDLLLGEFLQKFQAQFSIKQFYLLFLNSELHSQLEQILQIKLPPLPRKNISMTLQEIELIRDYNTKLNDYSGFFDIIELHKAYFDLADSDQKYALARKKRLRKDMIKTLKQYINVNEQGLAKLEDPLKARIIEDLQKAIKIVPNASAKIIQYQQALHTLGESHFD